jgi:hypothetical protein
MSQHSQKFTIFSFVDVQSRRSVEPLPFQTQEFLKMKQFKYFYAKKIESTKQLYGFKPQNLFAMKQYNYFYYYFYLKRLYDRHISVGGDEGIHRFLALKGQ